MNLNTLHCLLMTGAVLIAGCATDDTSSQPTPGAVDRASRATAAERIAERLGTIIPEAMARDRVPGVAVAVCDAERSLWQATYGSTSSSGGVAVTESTNFSAQSTSKALTALAVLHAAESGLVDLDRPIAEYVPGFTVRSRWHEDPPTEITLRMLLNHTAGLTHETRVGNNYTVDGGSFEEHVASIGETWLRFPPGSRQSYSNLGISVAGYVLQEVSGLPFEEYLHLHVLLPLGMNTSTFDVNAIRNDPTRAFGHRLQFDEVPAVPDVPPAGGLYSNLHDMTRFARFHLGRGGLDGARLVSGETYDVLYGLPFADSGQREGFCLGFELKRMGPIRYALAPGLGFGFICGVMWMPDADLGLVVMMNSQDTALPMQILQVVGEEALPLLARSAPAQPTGHSEAADDGISSSAPDPDLLAGLAGTYVGDEYSLVLSANGDDLTALIGNDPTPQPVSPRSLTTIVIGEGPDASRFRVLRAPDGTPIDLRRIESGESFMLNDRPGEPAGPDKGAWQSFVGDYEVIQWGSVVQRRRVHRHNGFLYLDNLKLEDLGGDLLATCTGRILDLSTGNPTFDNILLRPATPDGSRS